MDEARCRCSDELRQCAVSVDSDDLPSLADVRSPLAAGAAGAADEHWVDEDPVADRHSFHVGADGAHDAGGLMSEREWQLRDGNRPVEDVKIASAEAAGGNFDDADT